jgi:hypothetical protein
LQCGYHRRLICAFWKLDDVKTGRWQDSGVPSSSLGYQIATFYCQGVGAKLDKNATANELGHMPGILTFTLSRLRVIEPPGYGLLSE